MHDLWNVGHPARWLIARWDRSEFVDGVIRNHPRSRPLRQRHKAADWDACANPPGDPNGLENLDTLAASGSQSDPCKPAYNPFVSHAFFAAAEASGSACARTGWGARHLVARLNGKIAGIVPCYLKSHSQGEYVF